MLGKILIASIGFLLGVIGAWLFSDGLYSILLYLNTTGNDGKRLQTWRRDHWIRCVRGFLGIVVIVFGLALVVVVIGFLI